MHSTEFSLAPRRGTLFILQNDKVVEPLLKRIQNDKVISSLAEDLEGDLTFEIKETRTRGNWRLNLSGESYKGTTPEARTRAHLRVMDILCDELGMPRQHGDQNVVNYSNARPGRAGRDGTRPFFAAEGIFINLNAMKEEAASAPQQSVEIQAVALMEEWFQFSEKYEMPEIPAAYTASPPMLVAFLKSKLPTFRAAAKAEESNESQSTTEAPGAESEATDEVPEDVVV